METRLGASLKLPIQREIVSTSMARLTPSLHLRGSNRELLPIFVVDDLALLFLARVFEVKVKISSKLLGLYIQSS